MKSFDAVKLLLKAENLCILLISIWLYSRTGGTAGHFALLFFVPDLAIIGYCAGNTCGAILYNMTHSLTGALLCAAAAIFYHSPPLTEAGLIWLAHISVDRLAGYGLKYRKGFNFTHCGETGRNK